MPRKWVVRGFYNLNGFEVYVNRRLWRKEQAGPGATIEGVEALCRQTCNEVAVDVAGVVTEITQRIYRQTINHNQKVR